MREGARFGWSGDPRAHLADDITARVADRARAARAAAARVSRLSGLIAVASQADERLPELFDRLTDPLADDNAPVAATVWIVTDSPASYRPLAWTDGPAHELTARRLDSAPAVFVAQAASGIKLIALHAIVHSDGRRLGVAAAETVVSSGISTPFARPLIQTPVGLLAVEPAGDFAGDETDSIYVSFEGTRLLAVRAPPEQISAARRLFRWRWVAIASAPWLLYAVFGAVQWLDRRRRADRWTPWMLWSLAVMGLALATAGLATWLLWQAGVGTAWRDLAGAIVAFLLAVVGPVAFWCRARPERRPGTGAARFWIEQALGGAILLAGVMATQWLWRSRITPETIDQWHVPVLPSSVATSVALTSLLLVQIAMAWTTAAAIAMLAARWRVSWRSARSWTAALIWLLPSAVALVMSPDAGPRAQAGAAIVAASTILFGLIATGLRRHYRHTSEAQRLVLQFLALIAPVLAVYPLASSQADRATREVIARDYAPATEAARKPQRLMDTLTSAWADLDRIRDLPLLLARASENPPGTALAFDVWNQTVLARERVTSQLELYGPRHGLVSRFSLNVPEFSTAAQTYGQMWSGTSCEWDAFGETARFGAGERNMLHAERAVCGPQGEFLGAIVVRIIPDYRTLPFVASTNPYYDALGGQEAPRAASRIPELQVVVYGWSLQPQFVSGRVIWQLDADLAARLAYSRDPFWMPRRFEDRTYHVHFRNDRAGIYAVGFPESTPLQHATRLAESAALLALLFVAYLIAAALARPFAGRRTTPLTRLFAEVRASFNRKLFLFFVVAAVLPVILFAIVFGAYLTARLRTDVESEASTLVLMARRVLDELTAAQTPAGQTRPTPTDDVMVWIRQVVDQDVNLFDGPTLHATSQRDLFDSGLLPTRTPATVYRRITLERRPVAVVPDRIGAFRYLVAAVPVPGIAREAVLTVPLASRQREIERQIDELTRGVLAGAVVLVLFAAGLGASVAGRVSDPVARLSRATRLVAAGRFDERLAADTADELGRLVDDFNTMIDMLVAQRDELARTNQLRAWAEMSRQVAHEIKNPLTPIQLAAEHLQRVHQDAGTPLGPVVEHCLTTVLSQVALLRRIASEFSTFATRPTPKFEAVDVDRIVRSVVDPYLVGQSDEVRRSREGHAVAIRLELAPNLPRVRGDRTLIARALTNLVENALQAMPGGGRLTVAATRTGDEVRIDVIDDGVGMDAEGVRRAFEPYFSTKTGGSGLGLANARRNVEIIGGRIDLASAPGRGTTVTVTLPVAVDSSAPERGAARDSGPR
jgi:nitrogen fixation/metabolism regulation signal transduction histidine kinase